MEGGRTTGIEPARGGFTIHCLDPLGYIRPYLPTPALSLYLRSDPEPTPFLRPTGSVQESYTIVIQSIVVFQGDASQPAKKEGTILPLTRPSL
jgi:hypothetical protein